MMLASFIEESSIGESGGRPRVLGFVKPNTAMVATPSDDREGALQNEDAFGPWHRRIYLACTWRTQAPLKHRPVRRFRSKQAYQPESWPRLSPARGARSQSRAGTSRMPDTVDAMLAHARLSGLFACYAYAYATLRTDAPPDRGDISHRYKL